MKEARKKVTIKDVAERAGVPVRMAARALSGTTLGKRRDARERAERIRQAAKELGYCPSEIAVSVAAQLIACRAGKELPHA